MDHNVWVASPHELSNSSGDLKDLVSRGIVRAVNTLHGPVSLRTYRDYPQYKKHARWCGIGITLREAARTFKLPTKTVSQWARRGLITIIERTNREVYLDKADVAYCAEIRNERPGAGVWLFNDDRTPHVPTSRPRP